MKKIVILLAITLLWPQISLAQTQNKPAAEKVFQAEVIKVLEEKTVEGVTSQNLLLKGLEGDFKDKEINYQGVSDLEVVDSHKFKVGDQVFVSRSVDDQGQETFYITDPVRTPALLILFIVFVLSSLVVGGKKGLRSLIGLAVSFVIIIYFIVPQLLSGGNPVLIGGGGALAILAVIIYLSEGINKKSHLAVFSVLLSLSLTMFLTWLFTVMCQLTGLAEEEASFLIGAGQNHLDFRGLLLAGVLIGAAGVLDDVIIGQIESVTQIKEANPRLKFEEVFKAAYKIGNTHLGAIVNTLFLTYAGAALPLLLLFYLNPSGTASWGLFVNNEMIATEIVRTLVGGIGIAASLPITTYLAAKYIK